MTPDPDLLLRSNLERVFSERDEAKRALAIQELYVENPVLYEPDNVVEGRAAIFAAVDRLFAQFGPAFAFVAEGTAVGHHGLACLRWQAGPRGGPIRVSGTDAAEIVDGKISRLWVLLDPEPE
jgi:hypothetical protein